MEKALQMRASAICVMWQQVTEAPNPADVYTHTYTKYYSFCFISARISFLRTDTMWIRCAAILIA